jgi:DNA-binding NarL/FixJ family response regulator
MSGKRAQADELATDIPFEVVSQLGEAVTESRVAGELYISRKAVEYHLHNIYGKLGIASRRELRTVSL